MKLDRSAIIHALESGNNTGAVQVLFHYFRLGEVPGDLQIIRRVSPTMEMIYYNAEWYGWTAAHGFRKSRLPQVQDPPLVQIWFPL
jgi:hypothetical protein